MIECIPNVPPHLIEERQITLEEIECFVCSAKSVSPYQLAGKTRKREIVYPRMLTHYFARILTPLSLKSIGQKHNRDHTTVLNSIRIINNLMETDETIKEDVSTLLSMLGKVA